MNLLAPLGLLGLIALPIVVLCHMRHTTPLVRPVPTLRFWLAADPERTEQTQFRRPPLSLLLLLHLAIAALLAAALARPVTTHAWDALGLDLRTEPRHVILLLDGSTSMTATDTLSGKTRFEEARGQALQRLAGLREGDVATVLVLGTRTSTLAATDAGSFRALRERVAALTPPGGRVDLNQALSLTKDLLLPNLQDQVVVLTDGYLAADPGTLADLGAPVELALVGGAARGQGTDNVAVVDLAARANPSTPNLIQLYARVMNFSAAAVEAPVVLIGDGIEIGRQTATVPANGGSVQLNWSLPPGVAETTVRIETRDAMAADNDASLVVRRGAEAGLGLKILLVSDAPSELQRALGALDGAEVTTEPSTNSGAATGGATYDLIVFEKSAPPAEALAKLAAPLLFVDPPASGPFKTAGVMTQPSVSNIRTQDPLLAGVDLAGVTFGETPVYALDGTQTEVVGAADGPLVFRGEVGQQQAIVLGFDLAASNLPRRVAFPILIANAVKELAPDPLPASVPLGDPLLYRPRVDAASVRVAPPGGEPVDLPLAVAAGAEAADRQGGAVATRDATDSAVAAGRLREVAFADTGRPGVYAVSELDAAGKALGGGRFVVNAGHPRESDLRPNADLAGVLATARRAPDGGVDRSSLIDFWPLLILLGLALLGLEWLVALMPRRGTIGSRASATRGLVAAGGQRITGTGRR